MSRLIRPLIAFLLVVLLAGPLAPAMLAARAASDAWAGTPVADNATSAPDETSSSAPPAAPQATALPAKQVTPTPTPPRATTSPHRTPTLPATPTAAAGKTPTISPAAPPPTSAPTMPPFGSRGTPASSPSPANPTATVPLPASLTQAPSPTGAALTPAATPSPSPTVTPTPVDHGPGVPQPPPGPAVAPAQLLPFFQRAAQLTGVPQAVLLAIARVESGFDPRAVGPYLPQFAGTADEYALGLMQFLPSTYQGYAAQVDALTGTPLGLGGLWDPEHAILAAALYLRDNGAPGDLRRALFAYNHAEWYVDLVLAWSGYYAGGVRPDENAYNFDGQGRVIVVSSPQNPLLPVQPGLHLDIGSPIPLYAPFVAGQTWHVGGEGSFYGRDLHADADGAYYAVDFNKGTSARPEEDAGQPVLAAADGIVHNIYATVSGGWTVELYHRSPEGTLLRTLYLHLNGDPRVTAKLQVNQPVTHGTLIGYVGNTGVTSTGAHLHFALYLLRDGRWLSIRPEPMEGRTLTNGESIVSHNDPTGRQAFDAVWTASDRPVLGGEQRTWFWGPQPFASGLPETFQTGLDGMRLVQYYDKGRMEVRPDGKGGFIITSGLLARELVTGRVDLGGGRFIDYGPARIPLVGGLHDPQAPTYADVGVEATHRTRDYSRLPVIWRLLPGGKIAPFTPPVTVTLTGYDPVTGHNLADVFARWFVANGLGLASADGGDVLTNRLPLSELLKGAAAFVTQGNMTGAAVQRRDLLDPGRPLSDPFWVVVTLDGVPRAILVQVFERWVLTYTPDNPEGWRVELGNVGRHYYAWRYEEDARLALLNEPPRGQRRRKTTARKRRLG